jgi:hypothetical protein
MHHGGAVSYILKISDKVFLLLMALFKVVPVVNL